MIMKSAHVVSPVPFFFLFLFLLAGCASDDIPIADDTCAEGSTRCTGNVVQRCHAGVWNAWSDCTVNGLQCTPINGIFQCLQSVSTDSESIDDTNTGTESDTVTTDSPDTETTSSDSSPTDSDTATPGGTDSSTESDTTDTGDDTGTSVPDTSDTESGTVDFGADTTDTTNATDNESTDSESGTVTETDDTADTESVSPIDTESETEDSEVVPPYCGDGRIMDNEECDDGNNLAMDGCTPDCQLEPICDSIPAADGCESVCGDGVVAGEQCDDDNLEDGDGCSSTCTIEPNYSCPCECESRSDCAIQLRAYYRDFTEADEDFGGASCGELTENLVWDTLDNGLPVVSEDAPVGCVDHLSDWYAGVPDISGEFLMFRKTSLASPTYVNRHEDNGDKWRDELDKSYDGTPLFFPVDTLETDMDGAKIPPDYTSSGSWLWESEITGEENQHNFYFTSQLVYWFVFDASREAIIDILGDDDVWVFVNGKLVVDLGGLHGPEAGSVELTGDTATDLQLKDGKLYPIQVFHAERNKQGSSFQIWFRDFAYPLSVCDQ